MTERKLMALALVTFLFAAAVSGGLTHGLLTDTERTTADISVAGNVQVGGSADAAPDGNAAPLVAPSAVEMHAAASRGGATAVPRMGAAP